MPSKYLLNPSVKFHALLLSTERYFNFTVQDQKYICEMFMSKV